MANNLLYPATSPYNNTGVINKKFLDVWVDRPIPKLSSDRYWLITSTYNLRPDLLAFDLYGDAALWWVFIQRNLDVLQDPIFDFVPGKKIYICKNSSLKLALGL